MPPPETSPAFRRRLATAVALSLGLFLAGAIPRISFYGWDVVPSTLFHGLVSALQLGILAALAARWPARSMATLRPGAVLVLTTGALSVLVERLLSARFPGSMFPVVLYHVPPSLAVSLVSALTESTLWLAFWALVHVFPWTLDEARRRAAEVASLSRAFEVARMRERLEPALLTRALSEIGEHLEADPEGARERIAVLAEHLDERSGPALTEREPGAAPGSPAPREPVVMMTLRAPAARARFAVALVAVASLVMLSLLARFTEHGWPALGLELVSIGRIALELGLFVLIAERAAARGHSVTRAIVLSTIGSIAVGLLVVLVRDRLERAFPGLLYPPSIFTHPTPVVRQLVKAVTTALVDVAFWTLVYLLPLAREEAARRAEQAEALAREAELRRLRACLAPHFVRNALNVIAGLVTADPEEARRLLGRLGELLAELSSEEESHTIGREVAWLKAYGALLEARHPESLSFRFELDPAAEGALVPRLLLQPLVENAVLHGALSQEGGGEVRVRVDVVDDEWASPRIRCVVEDDGPGMRGAPRKGGLGVRLVQERLAACAAGGRLVFDSSGGGTRAMLELPLTRCA